MFHVAIFKFTEVWVVSFVKYTANILTFFFSLIIFQVSTSCVPTANYELVRIPLLSMQHIFLIIIFQDMFVRGMYSVNHIDKKDYLFWKLVRNNAHSYSQMDLRSQIQKTSPDKPVRLTKNKQYLRDLSLFWLKVCIQSIKRLFFSPLLGHLWQHYFLFLATVLGEHDLFCTFNKFLGCSLASQN